MYEKTSTSVCHGSRGKSCSGATVGGGWVSNDRKTGWQIVRSCYYTMASCLFVWFPRGCSYVVDSNPVKSSFLECKSEVGLLVVVMGGGTKSRFPPLLCSSNLVTGSEPMKRKTMQSWGWGWRPVAVVASAWLNSFQGWFALTDMSCLDYCWVSLFLIGEGVTTSSWELSSFT